MINKDLPETLFTFTPDVWLEFDGGDHAETIIELRNTDSQLTIAMSALSEIKNMDYRGNRHSSADMAEKALKQINSKQ